MDLLEIYSEVRTCNYKGEVYSVRDNGAIMRHPREGRRKRPLDSLWTFGKKGDRGYMMFSGVAVHRVVAFAFCGTPNSSNLVVDHIDTNRCNNRSSNLRWLTRLENTLKNPITRKRIIYHCGSIEAFLKDPTLLQDHTNEDINFDWMRTVGEEEARVSKALLEEWTKYDSLTIPKKTGFRLGEWIYSKEAFLSRSKVDSMGIKEFDDEAGGIVESLTENVVQIDWKTPSFFPLCPQVKEGLSLEGYLKKLEKGKVFCYNDLYSSLVLDSVLINNGRELLVMTMNGKGEHALKPWALTLIRLDDGVFKHQTYRTFFQKDGADKYFALLQGKEWSGGDVVDDGCW